MLSRDLTPTPRCTGARRREHGLTMIELLVGMVLLVIVGAMMTRGMLDGLQGQQHAASTQQATVDSKTLVEQLGNDLRAMSLRETSTNLRNYDLPELRQIVLTGGGINDLRIAQGSHLQFVADVVGPQAFAQGAGGAGSGSECVDYATAADGSLHRVVTTFDGTNCTATTLSDTMLLPKRVAGAPAAPAIFGYRTRVNTKPTKDPIDPNDCVSLPAPGGAAPTSIGPQQQRGFVVAVDLDLRAYAPRADVLASNTLHSTVSLRTRLSHDYQYALGCSY